jgi:hypothetical protein
MKRCPQCEFIYEDDQSLCDMDGVLLVFDSRTLPNNLRALAPIDVPVVATVPKAPWRHRTFPALAALILATVFSLVYFVSTQRSAPAPAAVSGASIAFPPSELPSPTDPNQTVPPPAAEHDSAASGVSETVKEETKPDSKTASTSAPAPAKKASSKTTERKPAEEPKKEDSKVGSILKKTGRILKKPFKF